MEKSPLQSIEQRKKDENEKLLRRWIEAEISSEAVFVTGISEGALIDLLNSGVLPASYTSLAPGFEKSQYPPKINYTFPIMDNLVLNNKDLADQLLSGVVGVEHTLDHEEVEYAAQRYAFSAAVSDAFFRMTHIRARLEDVTYMLKSLDLNAFKAYGKNIGDLTSFNEEFEVDINANKTLCEAVLQKYKDKESELLHIIQESLRHRGILLYLNNSVFKQGVVEKGLEDNREVVIFSEQGLSKEAISGVILLHEV